MDTVDILFVEDDSDLRAALLEFFQLSGLTVTAVKSALECFAALSTPTTFRVALVDLGLPDLDGSRLVEHIRQHTNIRIVVLTARNAPDTPILSYQAGADVYMSKPANARELVAAIRSLIERQVHVAKVLETDSGWILNRQQWMLTGPDGAVLKLTSKEFQLMQLLVEAQGRVVNREDLCRALYDRVELTAEAALSTQVRRLRARIGEISDVPLIKTAHGGGYGLMATVRLS